MQEERKYNPRGQAFGGREGRHFSFFGVSRKILVDEGIRGLAYAGVAYLLGSCRLFFGSYPLGVALLCASGAKIPFILGGLIASAYPAAPYPSVYIGVYIIALLLRVVTRIFIDTADMDEPAPPPGARLKALRLRLFNESVSLRMTAASVSAFIISLYAIIVGGYRYYDLFGAIFAIVASPAFVWLFAGYLGGQEGKTKFDACYLAGGAALMAGICYAARDINIMGISAAVFGAFFMTLLICRRHGILAGASAGLVLGIACDPVYAPLFVLAAIAEGMLCGLSPTLAASAAFAGGMMWGIYIDGIDSLTRLLPALLLAAAAFCGAERAGLIGDALSAAETAVGREEVFRAEAEWAKSRIKSDEERLSAVSESFAALSEVFYNLSDRLRRPGIIDLRRICDRIFDKSCAGCVRREICWNLEYGSSLDMVARICAELHEKGRADVGCVPEQIKRRCNSIKDIIAEINAGCASLTEAVFRSEKISLFALDYDAISRILADAVAEQREEYNRSDAIEERVAAALGRLGIEPEVLYVWGSRRKYISARGIEPRSARCDVDVLRRSLEEVTGSALEDPLFEFSSKKKEGRLAMTLSTRRRYSVERVCQTAAAADSPDGVCGDSVVMFETCRDYFYALISDGMGTGGAAAFSSGVSSLFLEKMLMAGNRITTALRMLNGVLRSRGGARDIECSATVDLLEIDLISGDASLIKSGAAPTYIRRSGDIFRLHSQTVPIGILSALDAQITRLELCEGDIIVMVSDGVADACGVVEQRREGGWLADLLSHEWEDDLSRMANKIIGRAGSHGSQDDLSVVIVRIAGY